MHYPAQQERSLVSEDPKEISRIPQSHGCLTDLSTDRDASLSDQAVVDFAKKGIWERFRVAFSQME